jgi:CelD/BcsL family acetyltransferase involved in cellulose biosynthesis
MPPLIWKNLPALALTQDTDLKNNWDRLNADHGNLPFLSSEALVLALQIFGHGTERLLVGQSNGHCQAMLLLVNIGKLRWEIFQPSQLPLGAWVAEPDLLIENIASSLLRDAALGLCLSLSITQIDPLFTPRGEDTASNRHDDYIDTAWVEIIGSFDDYWAARGKNLRQNMRKQRNKLQAESVVVEMRVWRDAADMPGTIARYGELEGRSWKAQEGTAIRPDNDQGRFYTALFQSAAKKGEAVVYEYLFDGKTVAINLCLRRASTLVILKTTYDESIKAYSPAFLLNEELTQALFAEQKIRRLEYYGRVMEWHTRWTDNRRTVYHLTSFRNGLVKKLAQAVARRRAPPAQDLTTATATNTD